MRRALLYMALIPPLLVACIWLVWSSQVAISRGNLLAIVYDARARQRTGLITNASASPGSSGGVAVNAQGEVLGIITRGFFPNQDMDNPDLPPVSSLTGLVPINRARPTLDKAANR